MADETSFDDRSRPNFIGEEYSRYEETKEANERVVFPWKSRRGECKYERVAYNGPRR